MDKITKEEMRIYLRVHDLLCRAQGARQKMANDIRYRHNCHSICRAICLEISDGSLECVDGDCLGVKARGEPMPKLVNYAHSWLVTRNGNIIDPFPVAIVSLGPLLVARGGSFSDFGYSSYIPNYEVTAQISNRRTWRDARTTRTLFHKK